MKNERWEITLRDFLDIPLLHSTGVEEDEGGPGGGANSSVRGDNSSVPIVHDQSHRSYPVSDSQQKAFDTSDI